MKRTHTFSVTWDHECFTAGMPIDTADPQSVMSVESSLSVKSPILAIPGEQDTGLWMCTAALHR